MTVFSITFQEFMAGWLRAAGFSASDVGAAFDVEGLQHAIREISEEEGPLLVQAEALEQVGSVLLDGVPSSWSWLEEALKTDAQVEGAMRFFAWAFDLSRRDELSASDVVRLHRAALGYLGESCAECFQRRISQIEHAARERDRRKRLALMPQPELVHRSADLDPSAFVEGRELARRVVASLRTELGESQFAIVSEFVRSRGTSRRSRLARARGVSPATATRAIESFKQRFLEAGRGLDRHSIEALLTGLQEAFEEVA